MFLRALAIHSFHKYFIECLLYAGTGLGAGYGDGKTEILIS